MLKKPLITYHDYLSLMNRDLSRYRYIIFTGESGSGKSSYLHILSTDHRDYQGYTTQEITPHMSREIPPLR